MTKIRLYTQKSYFSIIKVHYFSFSLPFFNVCSPAAFFQFHQLKGLCFVFENVYLPIKAQIWISIEWVSKELLIKRMSLILF